MLLFLGMLRPYKGIDELITAFGALEASRQTGLWIVGQPRSGELLEGLEALARATPGVRIVPRFVSADEVALYLSACDAVVLPYRSITTSGALALAMTYGRACLGPSVGGLVEAICGCSRQLYDPADGLQTALERFLSLPPAELERLGHANRARVAVLSYPRLARGCMACYRTGHTSQRAGDEARTN